MDREFIPEGLKDLGRFGASRIVRAWAKQNQLHVRKDINMYRSYDAYTFIYLNMYQVPGLLKGSAKS